MKYEIIKDHQGLAVKQAIELWVAVGWGKYSDYNEQKMDLALKNTDFVVAVKDKAGILIGLARVFSDGFMHTCIAEIVVRPNYQGQGIGTRVLKIITKNFGHTNIFAETMSDTMAEVNKSCGLRYRPKMKVFSRKAEK